MYSEGMNSLLHHGEIPLRFGSAWCSLRAPSPKLDEQFPNRATGFLLPPSLDEWLLELQIGDGKELSWHVSAGYHPA
jgi:hypothetical protein